MARSNQSTRLEFSESRQSKFKMLRHAAPLREPGIAFLHPICTSSAFPRPFDLLLHAGAANKGALAANHFTNTSATSPR
jgi:hypothetical protein